MIYIPKTCECCGNELHWTSTVCLICGTKVVDNKTKQIIKRQERIERKEIKMIRKNEKRRAQAELCDTLLKIELLNRL